MGRVFEWNAGIGSTAVPAGPRRTEFVHGGLHAACVELIRQT
jgi:hypothetical protein